MGINSLMFLTTGKCSQRVVLLYIIFICLLKVQLDKLPTENHGLKFSNTLFVIEPCQQEVLHIEWTPDSAGSWRHVVQVKGNLRLKLDIVITCSCVDPQKVMFS